MVKLSIETMNKKLKILFATHLFYPAVGGVEIHLKHLTEGLVKRGYDVNVVTSRAYSTEAFFLGDKRRIEKPVEVVDGVHVERLGFQTFGRRILRFFTRVACRIPYPFNHWIRLISLGPRSSKFTSRIIANNPDIIIGSPLPNMNIYYAAKAARKTGKPLIIISCYHMDDRCCFFNKIFFDIMRRADLVVPHTPAEGEFLARIGKINPSKIIPFPPFPLRENQLEPPIKDKQILREKYGIKEKYVVLYLGQHGFHKKVNLILKAMPYVWQIVKDSALVIAGGITEYTRVLKSSAAELEHSYGGKVYFIDNFPASEKDDIFQASDVFVSLSEMESFGIVFVEAMNNGLPMIASKNSVTRFIVDEGETGILIDPKSTTDVAGAILEILKNEELRNRFSENARKKVVELYHPKLLLDRWEEVFTHVTSNR